MFKQLVQLINSAMFVLNIIILIMLLFWSLFGVWEVVDPEKIEYWKIFISLVSILLFNLLLTYGVAGLYRRNIKLTDIFSESEYSQQYQDGDVVFNEGEHNTIMYLVVRGKIELVAAGKVLETVGSGGIFGEMAIIENMPRTAMARSLGESKLIAINEKRFYVLLQELPFFAKEVMQAMSNRLRRMNIDN